MRTPDRCYSLLFLVIALCYAPALQAQSFADAEPAMDGFGRALAVGENEVFVGEPQNTYYPGVAYVYTRGEDGTWEETAELTASDAENSDSFGQALALSDNTLLVGAARQDSVRGAVYVFERSSASTWEETAQLTPSDDMEEDRFGATVALSGDLAAVGAPASNEERGAVYIFERGDDGTWEEVTAQTGSAVQEEGDESDAVAEAVAEVAAMTGSAVQEEAGFGSALAIEDGRLFVGTPGQNNETGAVYVFEPNGDGTWEEVAMLTGSSSAEDDYFGTALSLQDGLLLVGAPSAGATGTVFTFQYDANEEEWDETGQLLPFDGSQRYNFGASMSFDGETAWVGAPGAANFEGQIYLFQRDEEDSWTNATKLASESLDPRARLAGTLAARGDVAVAGAIGDDYGAGSIVVFERSGDGSWEEAAVVRSEAKGLEAVTGGEVSCEEEAAAHFDCSEVDLLSFMPIQDIGGDRGVNLNDIWGWEDPETGTEYAIVGRVDGTSFVDISNPTNPVFVGDLPKTEGAPGSSWRDMKVYEDHVFIVSDNAGEHGMQVFDLTKLRQYEGEPLDFEEDAHYDEINSAHNIVINEDTGFAYIVGASGGGRTCGGGLHMVDIRDPLNPSFAGCFADTRTGRSGTGYTHDAQCVVYEGPDEEHQGREICLGSNETALSIADVTDKDNPEALAVAEYPNVSYTHQGWLTEDHRYLYVNDELDELSGAVDETRTLIWDVTDLDDPQLVKEYTFGPESSDHNLYVRGNMMYQSNYASGLRVHDISDPENPTEVGYFDTSPVDDNGPGFTGTWSNYPFFESGVIAVSSIGEGLFLLRPREDVSL